LRIEELTVRLKKLCINYQPQHIVLNVVWQQKSRITKKDERPTSNIERPTSNNDVAPLRQFINWQNSLFDVHLLLPGFHAPAWESIWYAFPCWSMGTRTTAKRMKKIQGN